MRDWEEKIKYPSEALIFGGDARPARYDDSSLGDLGPGLPPSSSGLGHHPLKVAARVQIPLGVLHSDDNALLCNMYAVNPHIVRHRARVKARLARKVP